jgi:hypothetical protein
MFKLLLKQSFISHLPKPSLITRITLCSNSLRPCRLPILPLFLHASVGMQTSRLHQLEHSCRLQRLAETTDRRRSSLPGKSRTRSRLPSNLQCSHRSHSDSCSSLGVRSISWSPKSLRLDQDSCCTGRCSN